MSNYLQELQREAEHLLYRERSKRELELAMARPSLEQAKEELTRLGLEPEPGENPFTLVFWFMGHRGTLSYNGTTAFKSSVWAVQTPQYPGVSQESMYGVSLFELSRVLFNPLLEIAVREARKKEQAEVHGEPGIEQSQDKEDSCKGSTP